MGFVTDSDEGVAIRMDAAMKAAAMMTAAMMATGPDTFSTVEEKLVRNL